MDHFAMLHSPAYASTIQSELEREHNRQAELLKHTKFLEQSIAKLHSDGTDLLNRFTKRLGILITTPAAFFSQARRLIKQHHVLEEKIAEFRRQISLLSSANQELVRRHHIEAARLLATATAIKSDNSFQNQHPTLNKLICSGNDVKVTEINKNGFHYNSDNMLPSSTSSESNYRNAISLNSVVIPPPPSLTKVSHNTLNCNKFGIPSIATSDNLVSAHEMNQQHSLNPIKSSNIKLRTSNGAPSVLRNNTDVHRFAPVLIKTVNTSNHSAVSVHTTNNKADRDHKVITDNSNNHNNTNNTTNNGTNHRIDKHMNIPPPPPLLPMHIHSDVYVDGALSSAKSPTDFNKHKYCNSNNNPSLLPELNRSFITCRTDYDMSLIQSNYRSHTKSMHASLQDLILDEFSRETPCISVSNCPTVTKTNKNRNVYSMSDSSYSCQYENNPDPLFQRHNHHNHNHKILHPNYIDYSHQLNLPPRKRHWDSSNYNPTTTNNYGEECEPPKLSRECKSTDMET
ncbi:Histone-lysine N-methyltransferase, H3 lysine-79 specific, variant 2 [Schistosoma haematobium]|nr:Histone-lysine N-methyltransferase, H3 lysine-79 specific, variant 2 [Schistosoma haematobium]KAH9581626.1 Histone-lysine N-methyltransferase, H3 lysine-79 specific, variant 2 [Schistosoma haematobium]